MAKIDISKRNRIMQRSKKLGHCICDPRRKCPCNIFIDKGVCPCAGERPEPIDTSKVRLTTLVHNAGCASKIPASDLDGLLARLPYIDDAAVISGVSNGDDAGVYRLNDNTTIVQTVDLFTPCVDDPYTFGKICAANCLSDIYAMGGVPRTALSVLAFPSETLDKEIMYLMLKGAMEVLRDAKCALIGGHSIKDEEIKLGFAVTGTIDTDKVVTLESARTGDLLVLTKPLGVGVLSFAGQIGRPNKNGLEAAERSMMALNKDAAEVMIKVGVSACTDITGFGLFGHLTRMMRHSGTSARIYADTLPAFEGVIELLRDGVIPGAIERNAEYVGEGLILADDVGEEYKNLGFCSETSGGLLIAVPEERHAKLIDELRSRGVVPSIIGEVISGEDGVINLIMSKNKGVDMKSDKKNEKECCAPGCCSEDSSVGAEGTASGSMKAFGDMVASITASGKIDKRGKELIIFALVVLQRCEACISLHYKKALDMGITKEELDEAAWCAVLIGGAPVKMYYNEYLSGRNKISKT